MVTEDYVSFEIAKLLKEKGFDSEDIGEYGGFYSERCYEPGHGIKTLSGQEVGIVYDDLTNSELDYDEYLRPTLQMAMKWLREAHQIFIRPNVSFLYPIKWYSEIFCYGDNLKTQEDIKTEYYNSPEEACEAAIKYVLEQLI